MELGLDLKITKTRHDTSTSIVSDFHFAQDSTAGHAFFSKEADTKFILKAHLRGYKRRNIEIKISEDGRELWVRGEKTVKEMTIMPLKMKKLEKEEMIKMREFKKIFEIPAGVFLDGIKAKYDEDEWILTIVMPKRVGIKEEEEEDPSEVDQKIEESEEEEQGQVKKRKKQRMPCCFPMMFGGSAFVLSLVLCAIHFIRFKHK
ncbi:hypothetical protein K1719_039404 [Acacia pycnantha]|nr:hypothetical protein K1719_039404 [Acacia pycnantha]